MNGYQMSLLANAIIDFNYWRQELPSETKLCYDWQSKEIRDWYKRERNLEDDAKKWVRETFQDWLIVRNIEGNIKFERFCFEEPNDGKYSEKHGWRICFDSVAVYNNVGSLDKRSLWLNKVVTERIVDYAKNSGGDTFIVRTHKVRTDANLLSPFDREFVAFVQEVYDHLGANITQDFLR